MTKAYVAFLSIFAALATSAAATATAFAHEFLVEGSAVTSLVDGTFTSATSHLRGTLGGAHIDFTAGSDSGTFSLSAGGIDAATVSFTSLALYETNTAGEDIAPLKCSVNEGKLLTFVVKTELLELNSIVLDTYKGSTPPLLINIPISGSSCAFKKAVNNIEGTFNAILPERAVNKVLHIQEFNPANTASQSLTFAGAAATFEDKESLVLSGSNAGKSWSGD
jgi:hypothetical protein